MRGENQRIVEALRLLDELQEVLSRGARVPFTGALIIDEARAFEVLDDVRAHLEQIAADKDTAVDLTRVPAVALRDPAMAQEEARRLLAAAHVQAETLRRDAEEYARDVLTQLHQEITRLERQIANGIRVLERGGS